MEEEKKSFKDNKIVLVNRENLSVSGVEKIIGVKDSELILQVSGTNLVVYGSEMEIGKLDVQTGQLEVSGIIDSLKFTGHQEKASLFKRIFK